MKKTCIEMWVEALREDLESKEGIKEKDREAILFDAIKTFYENGMICTYDFWEVISIFKELDMTHSKFKREMKKKGIKEERNSKQNAFYAFLKSYGDGEINKKVIIELSYKFGYKPFLPRLNDIDMLDEEGE